MNRNSTTAVPLVVDLDGTLVWTDTLLESALLLVRGRPLAIFLLVWWALHGKLRLKAELAARTTLDPQHLPWNQGLLEFLRHERDAGRQTVLATASRIEVADPIAAHLGLFDDVVGSSQTLNLKGPFKRDELVRRFGVGGFDYVGDSPADCPVWAASRVAHIAGHMKNLPRQALGPGTSEGRRFPATGSRGWQVPRTLRVHQWVKNVLVFLPAILNHHLNFEILFRLVVAFLAFSLVASAMYVFNDLFDLEADRRHPRKRFRPLAAGALSIPAGVALSLGALIGGFALALWLGTLFAVFLAGYGSMVLAYSLFLKRKPILDVVILAVFYTARIYAGGLAVHVPISPWLAQFSIFLFLSLAFVKRYSELHRLDATMPSDFKTRGYRVGDLAVVGQCGIASGFIAALVLALYVNAPEIQRLYPRPDFLWGICPVFVYWIARVWLVSFRGNMNEDPVLFASRDQVSYIAGFVILVLAVGAMVA